MVDYTITYRCRAGLTTWEAFDAASPKDAVERFAAHNRKWTRSEGRDCIASVTEGTCFEPDDEEIERMYQADCEASQ
jgi:hypothetical protein